MTIVVNNVFVFSRLSLDSGSTLPIGSELSIIGGNVLFSELREFNSSAFHQLYYDYYNNLQP